MLSNNTTYNVSIYALVDPFTGKAFYVGATKLKLSIRRSQHITAAKYSKNSESKWLKKESIIKSILCKGQKPSIVLLEIVQLYQAEERERFYVELLDKFFDMEQQPGKCNYTKVAYKRIQNGTQVSKWWNYQDEHPEIHDFKDGYCLPCTELSFLNNK